MTEKAQELMQAGQTPANPQQVEAFPSKEQHIVASIDAAIAKTEAEIAEQESSSPDSEAVEAAPEAPEATPKAKKVSKPAQEAEKPVEEPTEPPKKSKRELFAEAAEKEAKERAERQETKEWQRKYEETQAQLAEIKAFKDRAEKDPLGFFEEYLPPDTYEQLTRVYAKGEKPSPEKAELRALRDELKAIRDEIKQTREQTSKVQETSWIKDYMHEVDRLAASDEFKVIFEHGKEVERLTGEPLNLYQAVAGEYDEFMQFSKGKKLTPREVLEILAEKAEERISNYRTETPAPAEKKESKQARKPAKTLTNSDESESEPLSDDIDQYPVSREEHLNKVIKNVGSSLWASKT